MGIGLGLDVGRRDQPAFQTLPRGLRKDALQRSIVDLDEKRKKRGS
jgi:hypothetical protein